MGDVGLPALVRHPGLEPHERAPRPLLRLGGDKAPAGKDPPDRRDRGRGAVPLGQVIGDRVGAGIQPLVGKRLAELDDLVLQGFSDALRTAPRPPGARPQSGLPLRVEAPAELINPPG
jgi:hypothetical protein